MHHSRPSERNPRGGHFRPLVVGGILWPCFTPGRGTINTAASFIPKSQPRESANLGCDHYPLDPLVGVQVPICDIQWLCFIINCISIFHGFYMVSTSWLASYDSPSNNSSSKPFDAWGPMCCLLLEQDNSKVSDRDPLFGPLGRWTWRALDTTRIQNIGGASPLSSSILGWFAHKNTNRKRTSVSILILVFRSCHVQTWGFPEKWGFPKTIGFNRF